MPLDRIRVVQGDTARVATGERHRRLALDPDRRRRRSARASRTSRDKLKELAADELEAAVGDLEIADGAVRVAGTDRAIAFAELARAAAARPPEKLTASGDFVPPDATYPNGTHIAEVEIDPETGVDRDRALRDRRRFRRRR